MVRSDPLRLFSQLAASGERISALVLPAATTYLVHDPELVARLLLDRTGVVEKFTFPGIAQAFGTGIFNSTGAIHSAARHASKPAFHRLQIEQWSKDVRAVIEQLFSTLREGDIDVKGLFEDMALQMVGRLLFALDLCRISREFFACVEQMQQLFRQVEASPRAASRFGDASRRIDDLLAQAVHENPRARSEGVLFRLLLEGDAMSERQLLQEIRSFLMACVPAALLLASACRLLAAHPEEQLRLGGSATETSVDAVLNETLRLYPPAWLLIREAVDELELGGVTYPARTVFLVCTWTLHRAPRWFPEPERFLPDRWTQKQNLPRGSFIPFALGPRSCVGERLGRLIARQALQGMLKRFRLLPSSSHESMKWLPRITFSPSGGISVRLQRHP